MKKLLPMRPRRFSRNMIALADAFVPLIRRMVSDPEVVFTRPGVLAHHAPCAAPQRESEHESKINVNR